MFHKIGLAIVVAATLINFNAVPSAALKLWPTVGTATQLQEGTVIISSLATLSKMINNTVPLILRSTLDPFKFAAEAKQNATLDEQSRRLLSFIGQPINHVKRRSIGVNLCPITWIIEFQSTRFPSHIWKATCNGVGTKCLAPGSRLPGCREISVTYKVLYFRGIVPGGLQVWQWKREKIPVSCSC